jgi:hypothetical protein
MIKFDEYEDVNARIKRFRIAFPVGRIETDIVECDLDKGYVLIRARAYREHEDLVPAAVDYAFGHQAFYRENMKRWYIEDTSTSAIGRCISLLIPAEVSRATAQNMEQVENGPIVDVWATVTPAPEGSAIAIGSAVEVLKAQLGSEITETIPGCEHGRMLWKEGVSAKTGNAYKGWVCPSKTKPQCPPRWEKD